VLGGVVLAIMSGRSSASSIQRFIKNRIKWLRRVLDKDEAKPVSRAQLPRILAEVEWVALNEIIWVHFGFKIEVEHNKWYALDGKALRGIEEPGERVLLAVSHVERKTVAQKRMHGPKESEITAVREMLTETGLEKGKITLDALHFNPTTTQQCHQAGGLFIIQLKDNQPTLFEQMSQEAAEAVPLGTLKSTEKGHGRLEVRQAALFDIGHLKLDPRWDESGLATLIVMSRRTSQLAKQKSAAEVSFYLSNAQVQPADEPLQIELFTAIRQHWHIESDNYIRDVSSYKINSK
jgi:predicted transposase YbfD/YdcC